ncbi:cytochrome P450 [Fistulina hepatica ATCC 64428]|uniref:Cytochrome P450 n=1 Tax=Fistulina hepatica ATCC 64428 TaxID=1128425 RepID=A0A0D7A2D5_9AGAR|nr:cytochrome P450 [Fistulina hepatica ATCC 64428]
MFMKLNDGAKDIHVKDDSFVGGLVQDEKRHGLSKKESTHYAIFPQEQKRVMRKAQDELDEVVGRERLPTFEDKERLPYIRAMVKEILRRRPVGPLGVPRRATQDDWCEGYLIPKGATIIPNVWAMNRDPDLFPDFDNFRPERFLDETGQVDTAPADTHEMGHVTYGFGRRICAGYNFANQVLFIQIAMLLWAFNFDKPLDSEGKPITPVLTSIEAGIVVLPGPFDCEITPHFLDVAEVINCDVSDERHESKMWFNAIPTFRQAFVK